MTDAFRGIRRRITVWYVGVFAAILVAFGTAVYLAVTRQAGRALDAQLVAATGEIQRALEIREQEQGLPEHAVDALDELRIPGKELYVFGADGGALGRTPPPAYLAAYADSALARGEVWARPETPGDVSRRVYGRRIHVAGRTYAALAVTLAVDVDEQYPGLLASFLLAALGALLLVAVGGAALARKSLVPVEQSMARMRRFVADASHELRTPAAVLRTRAEVALQRTRSEEEYVALMAKMRDDAARVGRLVDGLLLLAAADEERLAVRKEATFLDDLLIQASEPARTLAASKGVTLELTDFEEAPVDADPELARQLILILLENAVKYTPSPGTVSAGVTADDHTCRLTVRDTGPGIAPDILPHVFERFYRADPARSGTGGAGLGLAIAKSIVDAHGGEIALDSVVGEGTTVRVSMRRRAAAAATGALVCAALLGFTAGPARAQTQPRTQVPSQTRTKETLTLAQAIQRAEAAAPELAGAAADSLAGAAGLEAARAFPNPSLALGYSRSVPNYHAEVELPLDYPWLRGPRIGAARASASAGALGVDVARAELRYRVEVAYAAALGTTALQRLSAQALADGTQMVQIAEARAASGDAATLDVALARVALGELRNTMLSDSLAAVDAALALQALLGMPQDRVLLTPGDSLAAIEAPAPEPAAAPLRLRAADSLVASEARNVTLARRSRLPAPALRFGFEEGDPTGSETGVLPTVGVSIPLPIFDRGHAAVAEAQASLLRAQADRDALKRDADAALPAARRQWETARLRMTVDRDAVQDARDVASLAQTAYQEGAYPLATVLEAQRSARDTLRRLIEDLRAGREAAAAYRLAATAGGATP